MLFLSEWDWVGAERSFQRALYIDPNHAQAYVLYGLLKESLGRLVEGLRLKQQALERDPSSAFVLAQIGVSYWFQRRYDEAIGWANRALERNPRNPYVHDLLSGAFWTIGDFERLLAEGHRYAAALGLPGEGLAAETGATTAIKNVFETGGRAEVFRYILEHMPSSERVRTTDSILAALYGEAGDLDAAFEHLDRALDARDPNLPVLAVMPVWDCLRGDARFDQRLSRMGLGCVGVISEKAGA